MPEWVGKDDPDFAAEVARMQAAAQKKIDTKKAELKRVAPERLESEEFCMKVKLIESMYARASAQKKFLCTPFIDVSNYLFRIYTQEGKYDYTRLSDETIALIILKLKELFCEDELSAFLNLVERQYLQGFDPVESE